MRSTFKILFYINRAKVKTDGTTAVLCRISIDGKQEVLTTGIYCRIEDWSARKGVIKTERENNRLSEFRKRVEHTYEHILKETGVISAELLKNIIAGVNSTPTLLLEAGEAELERLRLRSLETGSTSTYRQSRLTQRNLKTFVGLRTERTVLPLKLLRKSSVRCLKCFARQSWGSRRATPTGICAGRTGRFILP